MFTKKFCASPSGQSMHYNKILFHFPTDLHTQHGFQRMLPESISIVISPKHNKFGFFSLTQNYGLNLIGNCHKTGFHPHHNESPICIEAEHAQIDYNCDITIVDLR